MVDLILPAGTILKLTGIPVEILTSVKLRVRENDLELLRNWGVLDWKRGKDVREEKIEWEEKY